MLNKQKNLGAHLPPSPAGTPKNRPKPKPTATRLWRWVVRDKGGGRGGSPPPLPTHLSFDAHPPQPPTPSSTPPPSVPLIPRPVRPPARRRAALAVVVASCLCYSMTSLITTLTNKCILYSPSFSSISPLFLLFWQHVLSVALLLAFRSLSVLHFEIGTLFSNSRKSLRLLLKSVPLNLLFFVMLYSNTRALASVNVPVFTVLKSLSTVLTSLGDSIIFRRRSSRESVLGMAVMVASALVASFNDLEFAGTGYAWAALNCVTTSGYVLYMRVALDNGAEIGREFSVAFLNNTLSLLFVCPILLIDGEMWKGFAAVGTLITSQSFWDLAIWLANGIAGFSLSVASFWCVGASSPTTYSVVGALNKIPLAVMGWMLFSSPMTTLGVISIFAGLLGGLLYTHAKASESRKRVTA